MKTTIIYLISAQRTMSVGSEAQDHFFSLIYIHYDGEGAKDFIRRYPNSTIQIHIYGTILRPKGPKTVPQT